MRSNRSEEKKEKWTTAVLTIALGTFMASLDTSIVNVAMPVIQNAFHVPLAMVEWVVIAYLLVTSSLLLTFGRLSDLYGHKKMYVLGFGLFTIGSALCGFSARILLLIGARMLQATGAAMMFATGPAMITGIVPQENRGKAFSISAMAVAVALCTGPVIGGFLTQSIGWQSIFFINVPIGIIGTGLAIKNLPTDKRKETVPFDFPGSVLIFLGLIMVLLPMDIAGEGWLGANTLVGMGALGLLFSGAFFWVEKRTAHPLLNLDLFKNKVFTAGTVAAAFNFMAQFIMVFLAPFYLEKLRMLSPIAAGLLFLPMPLTTLVIAPICGFLSDRIDSRIISSSGMGIMAVGLYMLSLLKADTPSWFFMLAMIVTGAGSGMFQTPNNSAVMGSAPAAYRGIASGTLATMRNIGMVMGVAVSGALFSLSQKGLTTVLENQGFRGTVLTTMAFEGAVHITFATAAIIAVFAMLASLGKKQESPSFLTERPGA